MRNLFMERRVVSAGIILSLIHYRFYTYDMETSVNSLQFNSKCAEYFALYVKLSTIEETEIRLFGSLITK